jgi:hypothetical protein
VNTSSRASDAPRQKAGVADGAAFLMELVVVVTLAVAGARIGHGLALHVVLAVVLPLVAIAAWSVWMAPQSGRRLRDPYRFAAQVALFVGTAALSAIGGLAAWGIAVAVVGIVVFALTRRRPRESGA